jgi:hypothetical protein
MGRVFRLWLAAYSRILIFAKIFLIETHQPLLPGHPAVSFLLPVSDILY